MILVGGVMHRGLSAVLVQSLRCGAPGVFGNRQLLPCLRARFGRPRHRPPGQPLGRHRTAERGAHGRGRQARLLFVLVAASETYRSQSLQQRHAPLFGMVVLPSLAAPRPNFILRGDRQFVEPRHARRTRWQPLRLRRNERRRFEDLRSGRFRLGGGRIDEQGRFGSKRTDRNVLDGRGDCRLGRRFDRRIHRRRGWSHDRDGRRGRCRGCRPGRFRPCAAFDDALILGADALGDFRHARVRRRHDRPLR